MTEEKMNKLEINVAVLSEHLKGVNARLSKIENALRWIARSSYLLLFTLISTMGGVVFGLWG